MLALNSFINHEYIFVDPVCLGYHSLSSQYIKISNHNQAEFEFETFDVAMVVSKVHIEQGFIALHRFNKVKICSVLYDLSAELIVPHVQNSQVIIIFKSVTHVFQEIITKLVMSKHQLL